MNIRNQCLKICAWAFFFSLICAANKSYASNDGFKKCKTTVPIKKHKMKDRVWPTSPGDCSLSLWKDDKLAVFTITIDDNSAPDHDWWIEAGEKYTLSFTWFIIVDKVGKGNYWGNWAGFTKLHKLGHDIQSHTMSHWKPKKNKDEAKANYEYGNSIIEIQKNINGAKVITLAYPFGNRTRRKIAEKYFIGARGVTGGFNSPFPDLMNIKVLERIRLKDKSKEMIFLPALLNPSSRYFRYWNCMLFHRLGKNRDKLIECFEFLGKNKNDFWTANFSEVIKYIIERNSATLDSSIKDNKIFVSLKLNKEKLSGYSDFSVFDYPLTVKVRIDNSWESPKVTCSGKDILSKVLTHNNNKYLIISVVPNGKTPIIITNQQ